MSNSSETWTKFYTETSGMMYPAEAVIRIFKGAYPRLSMPKPKPGDSILDVGFGDGRHFPLFHSLGMQMAGSEITIEIVEAVGHSVSKLGIPCDLKVGRCDALPWPDASFDYLLTWNSCYYMSADARFEHHVAEMARVIKPGGWIVCSVPTADCFIFDQTEPLAEGYITVRNDYFGLRNGQVMRKFVSEKDAEFSFQYHFTNFCHASIDIDMFGLAYNWHVIVAQRTSPDQA